MLKNIDSFYYIGKDHTICDDFALVYKDNVEGDRYTLAMVADGCSSSKNSAIGARLLLTELAKQSYQFYIDDELSRIKFILQVCIDKLNNKILKSIYGEYFLDCTLLFSISDSKKTRVFVIGDGTLTWKSRVTDSVNSATFNFDNNMPFYLSYVADKNRLTQYKQQVRNYTQTSQNGYKTELSLSTNDDWFIQDYTFNHNEVSSLILCTDGISSFQNQNNTTSTQEIASRLIDIKNDKGVFIQRRAKRIFEEEAKKGIYHTDDFSCVALLFED